MLSWAFSMCRSIAPTKLPWLFLTMACAPSFSTFSARRANSSFEGRDHMLNRPSRLVLNLKTKFVQQTFPFIG